MTQESIALGRWSAAHFDNLIRTDTVISRWLSWHPNTIMIKHWAFSRGTTGSASGKSLWRSLSKMTSHLCQMRKEHLPSTQKSSRSSQSLEEMATFTNYCTSQAWPRSGKSLVRNGSYFFKTRIHLHTGRSPPCWGSLGKKTWTSILFAFQKFKGKTVGQFASSWTRMIRTIASSQMLMTTNLNRWCLRGRLVTILGAWTYREAPTCSSSKRQIISKIWRERRDKFQSSSNHDTRMKIKSHSKHLRELRQVCKITWTRYNRRIR